MNRVGEIIDGHWKLVQELSTNSGQGNTFLVVRGSVNDDDSNDDDSYDVDESGFEPYDGNQYVIKLLKYGADSKAFARFRKEIKSSLALQHPNIIKVIASSSQYSKEPYLVTEYCSGGELSAHKIKDLSLLERLRMFESICEAIAYAHTGNVIHRDIKPQNIFFKGSSSMIPIVGDFGLCFLKDDDGEGRLTATREAWGAREFRPPEADIGRVESCTEQSDVYMLGKLLYWFVSSGVVLVREYYKERGFDLRDNIEGPMIHFVYKVLDKSIVERPSARYVSVDKMLDDVKELVVFAENDARYLDCALPQSCVFCRIGNYDWQFLGTQDNDRYQFAEHGLNFQQPLVAVYPRVLFGRCGRCGNVQQFRLDDREKPSSEWKNVPPSPHAR